jgi:DNA-binding beta-propeller fold protein YncE
VDTRGDVYVADRNNHRIQKFTRDGRFIASWGRAGGMPGTGDGEFNRPHGVATDLNGNVYVADTTNHRVQKLTSAGRFIAKWGRNGGDGSAGTGDGEFNDVRDVAVDAAGGVYTVEEANHRAQKFTSTGRFVARWGRNGGDGSAGAGPGEFDQPRGIGVDRAGEVYVAEKRNHRVQRFTSSGAFVTRWGKGGGAGGGDEAIGVAPGEFNLPYDVTVDPRGDVYVADTSNTRVQKFTRLGRFLASFGRPGFGNGEFHDPYGVVADCRGNVYVTDEDNSRVQKFGDRAVPPPPCLPELTLGRPSREIVRDRGLELRARCDMPCAITVRGAVELEGGRSLTLRRARERLSAGETARLKLGLRGRGLAAVRRALDAGERATATVVGRARAFSGRSETERRRVRVRR